MGVNGLHHARAFLYAGNRANTNFTGDSRAPALIWIDAVNLTRIGIRSTDSPDRTESLYRLSYPGPHIMYGPEPLG
jgi:hypothetical protein